MRPLVCVYCEGNDTKFAAFSREKNKIRLLKAASIDVIASEKGEGAGALTLIEHEAGLQLDAGPGELGTESGMPTTQVFEALVNAELNGIKLANADFVAILTEPAVYYHVVSKRTTGNVGVTHEMMTADKEAQEKRIDRETFGKVELADHGSVTVYLRQDINCIRMINRIAQYNKRRYYKIVSVKSAEISLAEYVARRKKFFPDDYSLVVYIGKEYSKLLFLQGRQLRHIGSTLDVGTSNLNTYDVYFSKILLEMENGGVPTLDNIIVCGEDVSENLILSFYGTFPETNVSRLDFENIDTAGVTEEVANKLSSFAVPIAAATERYEEQDKKYTGINLLPRYVKEEQKFFQFAWHGYLMLPILFGAAFFITTLILRNQVEISRLNKDIVAQQELRRQNLEILSQIEVIDARINGFDQTQAILDSVSKGAGIWNNLMGNLSGFAAIKKNYWFTNIVLQDSIKGLDLQGYSLSRNVLPEVTSKIDSAVLKSIMFEPIREEDAFRFLINLKTTGK